MKITKPDDQVFLVEHDRRVFFIELDEELTVEQLDEIRRQVEKTRNDK